MLESTLRLPRLPIPVFRNLFFEHKKTFLPGFLRFFFLCFPGEFFTGTWFWRGHRNSGFWTPSQEFFAGIPVGQEFLYFLRIPPDSSGFLRIPPDSSGFLFPPKAAWLRPADEVSPNKLSHQQAHHTTNPKSMLPSMLYSQCNTMSYYN